MTRVPLGACALSAIAASLATNFVLREHVDRTLIAQVSPGHMRYAKAHWRAKATKDGSYEGGAYVEIPDGYGGGRISVSQCRSVWFSDEYECSFTSGPVPKDVMSIFTSGSGMLQLVEPVSEGMPK